jgi:hypothetical protein
MSEGSLPVRDFSWVCQQLRALDPNKWSVSPFDRVPMVRLYGESSCYCCPLTALVFEETQGQTVFSIAEYNEAGQALGLTPKALSLVVHAGENLRHPFRKRLCNALAHLPKSTLPSIW